MATPSIAPSGGPMDPRHALDWESLGLGYDRVSVRTETLIDLDVYVHGLEEIKGSKRPIAMIILSHGFANKAKHMLPMASGLIGACKALDAENPNRKRTRDLVVVTLDQRNHGLRRRIADKRSDHGPTRMSEIATAVTGGIQDHQLIMSFLADKLFPFNEREVVEYMVCGFSLGANVAWRLLRDEPRARIGVPIGNMPPAALAAGIIRDWVPNGDMSKVPPGARAHFVTENAPAGTYRGKKILCMMGGQDTVLPVINWDAQWAAVAADADKAARFIEEDKGHVVTPLMVTKAAEWFWYFGLTE